MSSRLAFIWIFCIQFSHAPGFSHPLFTFGCLVTTAIFLLYFIPSTATFTKELVDRRVFNLGTLSLTIFVLYIFVCITSIITNKDLHEKFLNYSLAYIWFFGSILTICFLGKIVSQKANGATLSFYITLGLSVSAFFSLAEYIFHFLFIDIGSYIPRPDRASYFYNHPILGYRVRAFNYESANLAVFANLMVTAILAIDQYVSRVGKKLLICSILAWLFLLFSTWSSVGLLLSIPIFIYIFFKKMSNVQRLILLLFLFGIFTLKPELMEKGIDIIYMKALGYIGVTRDMASANIRADLLNIGVDGLSDYIFTGAGPAGFYYISSTGLNNLYLMLGVQFGILGFLLLPALFYFSFLILCYKRLFLCSYMFVIVGVFLWFVGDFWIPQLLVPFFIGTYILTLSRESRT